MNKKVLISSVILVILITAGVTLSSSKFGNKTVEAESKPKISASYELISGLSELKNRADTIVESEGTDKYELIDYKGIKMRKTTVKVTKVIKGDKQLKELKFLQSEGVEGDEPLANGEKALMFLRKGIDNPDSYVTFGGTQGIFKITQSNKKSPNKLLESQSNKKSSDKQLEPHSMVNQKLLQEVSSSNYDDLIKSLDN